MGEGGRETPNVLLPFFFFVPFFVDFFFLCLYDPDLERNGGGDGDDDDGIGAVRH